MFAGNVISISVSALCNFLILHIRLAPRLLRLRCQVNITLYILHNPHFRFLLSTRLLL